MIEKKTDWIGVGGSCVWGSV